MSVKRRIYLCLLIGWGALCSCLYLAERVTGQFILIRFVRLRLDDFLLVLLCLLCASIIAFFIRSWRKTDRKSAKAMLVCGWIAVIFSFLTGSLIWLGRHAVTVWHEFDSPDKKYSLVAGESAFLLLSDIRLYERTSPILIKELDASLGPDDGFAAISRGAYEISWDGDVVTLSVDLNLSGPWQAVKIDMADGGKVLADYGYYPDGRPAWLDEQDDTASEDTVPTSDDSDQEDEQPDETERQINEGLRAVARTVGDADADDVEITYTAQGTPELVISSGSEESTYILFDRESANGQCALYVFYRSSAESGGDLYPQIVEMYAYEYASGRVITADRHDWSDAGTDEYREATGE